MSAADKKAPGNGDHSVARINVDRRLSVGAETPDPHVGARCEPRHRHRLCPGHPQRPSTNSPGINFFLCNHVQQLHGPLCAGYEEQVTWTEREVADRCQPHSRSELLQLLHHVDCLRRTHPAPACWHSSAGTPASFRRYRQQRKPAFGKKNSSSPRTKSFWQVAPLSSVLEAPPRSALTVEVRGAVHSRTLPVRSNTSLASVPLA